MSSSVVWFNLADCKSISRAYDTKEEADRAGKLWCSWCWGGSHFSFSLPHGADEFQAISYAKKQGWLADEGDY